MLVDACGVKCFWWIKYKRLLVGKVVSPIAFLFLHFGWTCKVQTEPPNSQSCPNYPASQINVQNVMLLNPPCPNFLH